MIGLELLMEDTDKTITGFCLELGITTPFKTSHL